MSPCFGDFISLSRLSLSVKHFLNFFRNFLFSFVFSLSLLRLLYNIMRVENCQMLFLIFFEIISFIYKVKIKSLNEIFPVVIKSLVQQLIALFIASMNLNPSTLIAFLETFVLMNLNTLNLLMVT